MARKKKMLQRGMDRVREEVLNTTKEVIDKTIPTITDGINKIVFGFTSSIGETIREGLSKKIEGKRKRTKSKRVKQEVNKNVDPKWCSSWRDKTNY